jgi:hypothetical protein
MIIQDIQDETMCISIYGSTALYWDSFDRESAHRKAATYTQDNTNTE